MKNLSLFYFLPKEWWSCGCFFFPASEAPKKGPNFGFLTFDKKYAKKIGIGSGLYGKSVLYLVGLCLAKSEH
jgi:hypothetical protein